MFQVDESWKSRGSQLAIGGLALLSLTAADRDGLDFD